MNLFSKDRAAGSWLPSFPLQKYLLNTLNNSDLVTVMDWTGAIVVGGFEA